MSRFTSAREKRLWIYTFLVLAAIYSTLSIARPLAKYFRDRGMLDGIFFFAFILVLVAIVIQGFRNKPGKTEIAVWIAIIAAYLMVFLRMAIIEERTHLMEYAVVALLIHEALKERKKQNIKMVSPTLMALLITTILGVLDECIQYFLPNRVFDTRDILFNFLAGLMAIGGALAISWARNKVSKNRPN